MAAQPARPEPQGLWYIQAGAKVWGPYPQARLARFVDERRLTTASLIASQPSGPFGPAGRRRELLSLFQPSPDPTSPNATSPDPTPPDPTPPDPFARAPEEELSREDASGVAPVSVTPVAVTPVAVEPLVARSTLETTTPEASGTPAAAAPAASVRAEPLVARAAPGATEPSPATSLASPASATKTLVVWAELSSLTHAAFEAALAEYGAFAGVRLGVWLIRTGMEPAPLRNALSKRLAGEDTLLVIDAPLDRAAWFNLDRDAEWNLRHLWAAAPP